MRPPKTLLLARTAPGSYGVGPLFLRDLIQTLNSDDIAFAILKGNEEEAGREAFPDIPALILNEKPLGMGRYKKLPATISALGRHIRYRLHSLGDRRMVKEICKFASKHEIEQLWAIFHAPTIFRIAPAIAKRLNIPMIATVWDPPEGVGFHTGLDRLSRKQAVTQFAAGMRYSNRASVISERMRDDYQKNFGTQCTILRHGISPDEQISEATLTEDEFRIGFCGSLYAIREWNALLAALESCQWQIQGRPVRLTIASGNMPPTSVKCPAQVDFLGWRDMIEVVEHMSRCHACYFPYWFNPAYKESVRYCFATKLTTYLTAGTPVLYHGPADAAVVDFFQEYPVAETCHSLTVPSIVKALNQLGKKEINVKRRQAIRKAISDELNQKTFYDRFNHLLLGEQPVESS